jgi:hypothetical protein
MALPDWQALLADPVKHWKPGYSAMSTAQSWEHADDLPPEITALLGGARLIFATMEHKVPMPGPGADSQCDVFALVHRDGTDIAVAVEAKVNEPFGQTIGEWFDPASPSRTARLSGLCDLLDAPFPPPPDLRYQLFHRTAAAVIEARRLSRPAAAMLVQSFSPDDRWFDDFAKFCTYLGCATPTIGTTTQKTLPDGRPLILGWAKSDPRFLSDLAKPSDPTRERSS